jgi:Zn-dependent M28 family amino/carboxypeptidase
MSGEGVDTFFLVVGIILCIFVIPYIGFLFFQSYTKSVPGANDNLSGCLSVMSVIKLMEENNIEFENTEVGVIISGSEEAGLRGSSFWAEKHKDEFSDVPTFIYSYDTIFDPKFLMTNYRDLNGTVKVDKDVSDLFMECAEELNIHCLKGMVPPLGGATDSAAFAKAGMRATGITGLNHNLQNYYHTRRDTYDNMNLDGLADCFAVSVKVLEKFDMGAKQTGTPKDKEMVTK